MLCLAIFARCHPIRVESLCRVECPCLSLVISNSRIAPTISSEISAPGRPAARVAIMVTTRPPIMIPVPSVPRPAIPALAGARQLP